MELFVRAPVWGQSGFEVCSRGILLALDKLGVRIELNDKREWNLNPVELDNEDASRLIRMMRTRVHPLAPSICQQFFDANRRGKFKYCFTLFETDKCPDPWINPMNELTETWVFSDFCEYYWKLSGVKNVQVLPWAVDTNIYRPDIEPIELPEDVKGRFVFFANGDYTERKWFEGLIEAYVKEFKPEENVVLIIKSHYGGFTKPHREGVRKRIAETAKRFSTNFPMIRFYGENIPERDMPRLYAACNCYVLASRGEGLGLPYAEAMACGKPCISTNWGGQTDFINDDNGFLVDCTLEPITDQNYITKCINALGHRWALPNITQLRRQMRVAFDMPEICKEKGKLARKEMEKRTWQKSALWIINRINQNIKNQ